MTTARAFAAILTMGIPMVLVRVLDQTTFGHYKQLFLVAGTALPLLSLGLPGSLYYFVPQSPGESQRYHVQTAFMLGILGVIGGLGIVLARDALSAFFDAPLSQYAGWIALYVALSVPAGLVLTSPMVDKRAPLAASLVAGLDLLRAAALIVVAVVSRNLVAILVAACAVMVLRALATAVYLAWRRHGEAWRPSMRQVRRQLAYALPFTGAALIGLAQTKLHAYYVAASFSAAQFAIYAVATLNIPLIGQFSRTIGEVVILENADHFAKGRNREMRRVWHRATLLLGLVLIPLFLIAEIFAADIIGLLFGTQYLPATPIFRVFLFMLPLGMFLGSPMLRATGDLGVMVGADTLGLLVAIAVLVVLSGPLGPLGAVTSLIAGRATFLLLASRRTAGHLQLGFSDFMPWKALLEIALIGLTGALVASLVVDRLGLPLVIRLLAGGALASAFVFTCLWLADLIPETEKSLIRNVIRQIPHRLRPGKRTTSEAEDSEG
jgi:O-antigen/teichoic acid export membrane protein